MGIGGIVRAHPPLLGVTSGYVVTRADQVTDSATAKETFSGPEPCLNLAGRLVYNLGANLCKQRRISALRLADGRYATDLLPRIIADSLFLVAVIVIGDLICYLIWR